MITQSIVQHDDAHIAIVITDEGPGIPPDLLSRIGNPFEQGGNLYKAEVRGLGLGLALTRQLMEMMNGTIEIDSAQGEGTSVRLVFGAAGGGAVEETATSNREWMN